MPSERTNSLQTAFCRQTDLLKPTFFIISDKFLRFPGLDSRFRGNDGSYITQKKLKPNSWDSLLREADRCRLKDFQTA